MNNTAGGKTIDLKMFGTLTLKQLFGLISAFVFALALLVFGFGYSCTCFGMLVIAVILFMLPRMLGVENLRLMTAVGVIFAVTAILIGGLFMAPGFVENNRGSPTDTEYLKNIEYTPTSGGIEITATLIGDKEYPVTFEYGVVQGVGFGGAINGIITDTKGMTVTSAGGVLKVSGYIDLDSGTLYAGYLKVTTKDNDGNDVSNTTSTQFLTTEPFYGSIINVSLYGCLMATLYVILVFFLIMILSNIMKVRMEKTREKMEKDGRLYPQGYGRCKQCGAVVLPGEVSCRKCGAYIDRPDEMKPKKKDFFECSECGAEVPTDAKQCPKCGAAFDEEEIEVVHADGTVETTKETFECSDCGAVVPSTAAFCPKCGSKFDEDDK